MKILFLSRQLNIGGAERQLVTLANELAARGHEIVIASYYPGGALAQMIDPKRIKVISYEKKSRWDLFTLLFKTLKIVREEQPTDCARLDAHAKRRRDGCANPKPQAHDGVGVRASNLENTSGLGRKAYDLASSETFALRHSHHRQLHGRVGTRGRVACRAKK